jgi:hypothetical protein
MNQSRIKPFHLGPDFEDDAMVLLDHYLRLTSLLEASTSILEAAGYPTESARGAIAAMDRLMLGYLSAFPEAPRE